MVIKGSFQKHLKQGVGKFKSCPQGEEVLKVSLLLPPQKSYTHWEHLVLLDRNLDPRVRLIQSSVHLPGAVEKSYSIPMEYFCGHIPLVGAEWHSSEQECILFRAGKTRVISNCSHLFRSRMLRSCQFRVGVLYFA